MDIVLVAFIIGLIALLICLFELFFLGYNKIHYGYSGKKTFYLVITYLLCYCISLFCNLTTTGADAKHPVVSIGISFWHAIKMISLSFDTNIVKPYFGSNAFGTTFGISYVVASATGAAILSISVISLFIKTSKINLLNILKLWFTSGDIYLIFSDAKDNVARKLGKELVNGSKNNKVDTRIRNRIIIMVLSSASLKTQLGTEYKDQLIADGFEVWSEEYTKKFANYLFRKRSIIWRKHQVTVLGLFSNDDMASDFALNFKDAIQENETIQKIKNNHPQNVNQDLYKPFDKKELRYLNHFRVFVSYHEHDYDYTYNISGSTLHIINTISQYDMISTSFLLDNPLSSFVDINSLKKDNDVANNRFHVTFLGFGKVNKPIYKKMITGYQLWGDNINKICYHIIDKDPSRLNINESLNFQQNIGSDNVIPYLYRVDYQCLDLSIENQLEEYIDVIKNDSSRFNTNGFELFIISLDKTYFDVTLCRKLHFLLKRKINTEKLNKTIIFIRFCNTQNVDSFIEANKDITINQSSVSKGYLLSDNHILCPIVPFGQNILLSDYLNYKFNKINQIGMAWDASYNNIDLQTEDAIYRFKNKRDVLKNTAAIFSLQNELKIFGFDLDSNFNITKEGKAVSDQLYYSDLISKLDDAKYNNCSDDVVKLAELEHNRWLVSIRQDRPYTMMKIEEYVKFDKNGNIDWNNMHTSSNDNVTHVCMTTNEGLKELYDYIEKVSNNSSDMGLIEKIVFDNDISQLRNVFKVVKE